MSVVSGKANWASVQTPNTKFQPQWCIDLEVSDGDEKALLKAGLTKNKNGWFKFSRRVEGVEGKNKAPVVVDTKGKPFNELIGNGSEVRVQYKTWKSKKYDYIGADLVAVQVVEHIPYGGGGLEFEIEEEDTEFNDEVPF